MFFRFLWLYSSSVLTFDFLYHDNCVVLMSVFCITSFSLFAAQAGASRVIAVEASEKMASISSQVKRPLLVTYSPL